MGKPERAQRFNRPAIAFHWLTVLVLLGLVASAWLVGQARSGEEAALRLLIHRSLGVGLWLLTLARMLWRRFGPPLPPFPPSMPRLQQWAAKLNEYGLYAILLVQPLTGLGDSLFRGRAFPLWLWTVPPLVERDKALAADFHQAHVAGVVVLAILAAVHVAAALLHAWVLRDGVFQRMAPWVRRRERGSGRAGAIDSGRDLRPSL